jgi:prephenate dehydrogenase
MNEDMTKQWARIQEGLLILVDHATALERMMDRNPAVAISPARKATSDSLDKRIAAARKEIEELEEGMSANDKRLLYEELEEVRKIRRLKAT